MKKIIVILTITLGFVCFAQDYVKEDFEEFSEEYVSREVKNDTLLILKYRELSADEAIFNQDPVKHKVLLKFVHKENIRIELYNYKLEKVFADYYSFPYKIIDEKDLKNYPSSKYPFLYKRYAQVRNNHFVSYSRFFMNRRDKKLYKDLNLFTNHRRERLLVEKDVISALDYFLLEEETPSSEESTKEGSK